MTSIDPDDYWISFELNATNNSYVYGEINSSDFIDIVKKENVNTSSFIQFLDVGSGCGRLLMQLYSEVDCILHGVEIDSDRFAKSVSILKESLCEDRIEFFNTDFRNLYFGSYDILYCCNCIFEDEENNLLFKKILQEFSGTCFLFEYNHTIAPYLENICYVSTSWHQKVPLYMFRLDNNRKNYSK
jgi:SAM-dependent methyltransferase